MGYRPLVLLVGADWRSPPPGSRHEVVVRALRQLGDKVKVEVIASDEEFNTAAVAQIGRLYACLVDGMADDEYLLTTDADLIPLSAPHFSEERNWNRRLHLYNSFCCAPLQLPEGGLHHAKQSISAVRLGAPDLRYGMGVEADHRLLHLPISYAGATASVWRQLMGLSREEERELRKSGVQELLRLAIESRLLNDLGSERAHMNLADNHRHADMDMWHLDQRVLSAKVAAWKGFPSDTEMTSRYGHRDRVDRINWVVPGRNSSPQFRGWCLGFRVVPGLSPSPQCRRSTRESKYGVFPSKWGWGGVGGV
jgi:hypothetical protein